MLNDLDNGSGVESFEPFVAIHEGAVDQFDSLGLLGRQPLQPQPPLRDLKPVVVYRALKDEALWTRALGEFYQRFEVAQLEVPDADQHS